MTLNGPLNEEDVAYSLVLDNHNNLFQAEVYSEPTGGANIWVAAYNTELNLLAHHTVTGESNGYDSGYSVILGNYNDFYLTGFVIDPLENNNLWIAQ